MKHIKISLATALILSFLSIWNFSCQKEIQHETSSAENAASSRKPDDPGFAENDMVMYWNDKAATVLSTPMNTPTRSRYFAIIEIAVHDALKNLKAKYERY